MSTRHSYIIATSPRSGSWLLSSGLEDTRIAGHPSEWFNGSEEPIWCRRWNIPFPIQDYRIYLSKVLEAGTKGGIFGAKCHAQQFEILAKNIQKIPAYANVPLHEAIASIFPNPRYIRLKRHDIVRQAISYYRASKTNEWWLMDGHKNKPGGEKTIPDYSAEGIQQHENILRKNEAFWDCYILDNKLDYLELYYEDLAADYPGTLKKVLQYLNVENAKNIVITAPRFHKQSDSLTEEWLERYTAFKKETAS